MKAGRDVIRYKDEMYKLLAAGAFGNTIPQYFSLAEWYAANPPWDSIWGVRTLTPGGPCALQVHMLAVPQIVRDFAPHKPNISVMIDAIRTVTLWANVLDGDAGIVLDCIEYPDTKAGSTWRKPLEPWRHLEGVAARLMLHKHLNANSYDDLLNLMELYPRHVYELSAVEGCYGTVPGRNAVMWEVRNY